MVQREYYENPKGFVGHHPDWHKQPTPNHMNSLHGKLISRSRYQDRTSLPKLNVTLSEPEISGFLILTTSTM
jgi:hypothetical protein